MQLFDQEQALILIRLLIAHILADFIFQPTSWIKDKKENGLRAKAFYKHLAVVGVLSFVAAWRNPGTVLIITITHGIIDYWKVKSDKKGSLSYFIADQLLHLVVILISWLYIIEGWNRMIEVAESLWTSFDAVIILLGYLFCIGPTSYIIKFATKNLIKQENDESIKRGGKLIGIFERIIIFTFVLFNQYEAIGFLITGKSILRFADGQKKETEYVLVGTMISYAIAILMGALVNLLIPG